MMKILIFSGTTEGRNLSELLADSDISHDVSVATEYGELVMQKHPLVTVYQGRLAEEEMYHFMKKRAYQIVVDATHPYATVVTKTILKSVKKLQEEKIDVRYLRLKREINSTPSVDQLSLITNKIQLFSNHKDCICELKRIPGNILLTTGSKDLSMYCQSPELKKRLFVRVLPGLNSLKICKEQGLLPKQIIALQGPFSEEMNIALIHQYQISCLVTKQGGTNGGFEEKVQAAQKENIPCLIIQKENAKESVEIIEYSFGEVCEQLEKLLNKKILSKKQANLQIAMVGTGMGSEDSMTIAVHDVVTNADLIVGAKRLVEHYTPALEKKEAYMPEEILNWLIEKSNQYAYRKKICVAILFSGDSGFYSGCQKVRECLEKAFSKDMIQGSLCTYPGISSIQAMSAACGLSWQDAGVYSIHGRNNGRDLKEKLLMQVEKNDILFLLVTGPEDIKMIGELLDENYMVYVGYQLSYEDEKVSFLTPAQCREVYQKGLYSVVIKKISENKQAKSEKRGKIVTPYLTDQIFVRDKIPMTKEEIRHVSVCKLHLTNQSILYDIGSGTGSMAIESAMCSDQIKVYAIEQKEEAVALLHKNKEKFQAANMEIINGTAPEIFECLEIPTHAFIGGSSGNLFSILSALYDKNPEMRVVLNAVSLETVAQIDQLQKQFSLKEFELIQLQVSKYRQLGAYHMPKSENAIFVCSFQFVNEGE